MKAAETYVDLEISTQIRSKSGPGQDPKGSGRPRLSDSQTTKEPKVNGGV